MEGVGADEGGGGGLRGYVITTREEAKACAFADWAHVEAVWPRD